MASCELCGATNVKLSTIKVAGSTMLSCNNCSHLGKETAPQKQRAHTFFKRKKEEELIKEVITNYASLISSALSKKGLTQKHLARATNIRESSIQKYCQGKLKPDVQTAQKLENFLEITLIEEVSGSVPIENFLEDEDDTNSGPTLGDLIKR